MAIELTEKRWKKIQLIGAGIFCLGLPFLAWGIWPMVGGDSLGTGRIWLGGFVSGIGLTVAVVGDALAWWHHG